MKKLMYILAAAIMCVSFTGCNKTNNADTEAAAQGNPVYNQTDFALYTLDKDNQPSKFVCMLGVDENQIKYEDETAKYVSDFLNIQTVDTKVGDPENPGKTLNQKQIRYISYEGSHTPVVNVRGIKTTGIVMDDDKCSTADEIITAYGISKISEGYIEEEREDGSYVIRLNFKSENENGEIERIISEKGSDLNVTDGRYSIRFNIINDHVHGIEYYMYY